MKGLAHPNMNFTVFNHNLENMTKAILERVIFLKTPEGFILPPRPIADQFKAIMTPFRKMMKRYATLTPPMSTDAFIESYRGKRQFKIYQQAAIDNDLFGGVMRKHAHTSDFIKAEKTNKDRPRVIRPSHPRYNVVLGCYIKTLEHKIYEAINKTFGYTVVVKGMNATQRAELIKESMDRFKDPVVIPADAKQFDQHVSRSALDYEFAIYRLFNNDPEFVRLLSWQINNVGSSRCDDGYIRYEVEGSRCSGVMNTSLGNIVIMCALVYNYFSSLHLTTRDYTLIDDGDDFILIMERPLEQSVRNQMIPWFKTVGFTLVVGETADSIHKIEFCQSSPIYDGRVWTMVREPLHGIAKDSISLIHHTTAGTYRRHIAAVAICGLSIAGGIPVWDAFYRKLLSESDGAKPLFTDDMLYLRDHLLSGMNRSKMLISHDARVSFYKAFRIPPPQQTYLEDAMTNSPIDTSIRLLTDFLNPEITNAWVLQTQGNP